VGEKEVADKTVSVRVNKTKEQFTMSADQFITEKVAEYKNRQ
jgi:threonyl-tRNA synthetase